jgi:protein TonB
MRDRVADVLAQRATLDRGAGIGVAVSLLLHAALAAAVVYAALHASPPEAATAVNIQFAKMPPLERRAEARPASTPKIEEPKPEPPKPKIEEPKPEPQKPAPKPPEKNTVPLSPFGRSTKKGSETPAPSPAPPPTANRQPPTEADVPAGASGITGIEGGDFPYTLYIQGMHRKIGNAWFRPPSVRDVTVVIAFRILRDGTIQDAKVVTPSGNSTFDRAALSAVRSASPLNPLPFAYSGNYLGVQMTFR